ncbi:salicylate hydroxylase [Podospora fimiseda]|uniref:Salicylate hydroxylase n=1 Tax=Podospora fimiseda TaxID=252190 RepID=A0AAN7BJ30_9PEZI|nr:salicylate hydroxylase [Podospora fimiseda]
MSLSTPFKIAIIGGGISGLSTALFIHHFCSHQNIQIDIYEKADSYRDVGAGLTIGVNAAKLLHLIGLGDALNAISGSRDGIWFTIRRLDTNKEVTTIHSNDSDQIRQASVSRSGLLNILLKSITERKAATLHNNKQFLSTKDLGHETKIIFSDSTSTTANLLLASDGIHSLVRNRFVSDSPIYTGKILYRGTIPINSDLKQIWTLPTYSAMWIDHNKHLIMYSINSNKTLNFVGCVTSPQNPDITEKESWSTTCSKSEFLSHFQTPSNPLLSQILSLTPSNPSKWIINDRNPIPQWIFYHGKIVLLGDAAHPMVPHQSAGAGQAIEDGYILAKALSDYLSDSDSGLEKYMSLYQKVRLPRTTTLQTQSRDAGNLFHLNASSMKGKSFDDRLKILSETIKKRLESIWTEDLDVLYDKEKASNIRKKI